MKEDFKKYVIALQKPILDKYHPKENEKFQDERGWDLIFDGTYIRNYDDENVQDENVQDENVQEEDVSKLYGEILLQFELLLNYLTAILFQKEAEKADDESKRIQDLITALKKSLFTICDVHDRETSERDWKNIKNERGKIQTSFI